MTFLKNLTKLKLNYLSWNGSISASILLIYNGLIMKKENEYIKKYWDNLLDNFKNISNYGSSIEIDEMSFFNCLFLYNIVQNTENAIVELLRLVLLRNPQKIPDTNISFKEVLKLSKSKIIDDAIDKYIQKILYNKPEDYLKAVYDILSIECIENDIIEKYCEMKARRDLGIHNNWKTNKVYLAKSKKKLFKNENMLAIPDNDYLVMAYDVSDIIISDMYNKVEKVHA